MTQDDDIALSPHLDEANPGRLQSIRRAPLGISATFFPQLHDVATIHESGRRADIPGPTIRRAFHLS
jgi:hypothetical protein